MSEVLDQGDIDALLNSVASDAVTTGFGSMMQAGPAQQVAASVYDFKRPERVSKDQIRALSSIHEAFARNFGATLSGLLRTIIDVRVVGVEQLTYSEFVQSLPNPTCFVILSAPPLEGQMCMEVSPLIVYPIIDRLLGGSNSAMWIPQRPLTTIEWRLIQRLIDRALEHLSEVWQNLAGARFELQDTETNPQLVHIVAPTEVVVFITFEIKLGQNSGTMSLCIPYNVIESVLGRLTTQAWFYKPRPANEQQQQRLTRSLIRGRAGIRTFLGQARIKLSDLRTMKPGDLLTLDKRTGQDLLIQVAERTKFAGKPGQVRGHKAIRITRAAAIDEPV